MHSGYFRAPHLRLSAIDRTVYAHLLRHSRLEGKLRLHFSIPWLGRNIRLSMTPVRKAVRRLVTHGALRLVQRSKAGHVVEVRLPEEIPAAKLNCIDSRLTARQDGAATRQYLPLFVLTSKILWRCRPRSERYGGVPQLGGESHMDTQPPTSVQLPSPEEVRKIHDAGVRIAGIMMPHALRQMHAAYGRTPQGRFVHYTTAEAALNIIRTKRF